MLFVYPTSPVYRVRNLQPSSAEKLQVLPQVKSVLVSWLTWTEDCHKTNQTFLLSLYRTFEIPHQTSCLRARQSLAAFWVSCTSGYASANLKKKQTRAQDPRCCFLERLRQLTTAAQLSLFLHFCIMPNKRGKVAGQVPVFIRQPPRAPKEVIESDRK